MNAIAEEPVDSLVIKHSEIWEGDQDNQIDEESNKDDIENSDFLKVSQDSLNPFGKNGDFMFETQKCDFSEL